MTYSKNDRDIKVTQKPTPRAPPGQIGDTLSVKINDIIDMAQ